MSITLVKQLNQVNPKYSNCSRSFSIVPRIAYSTGRGLKNLLWHFQVSLTSFTLTPGWFSMSPLPRLHHHDIMTIVELFFILYIPFSTIRRIMLVPKDSAVHCSRQQCLVAKWLGHSVTVRFRVRVRARARARESFFFVCVKIRQKDFVLARCNNSTIVNMKNNSTNSSHNLANGDMENQPQI